MEVERVVSDPVLSLWGQTPQVKGQRVIMYFRANNSTYIVNRKSPSLLRKCKHVLLEAHNHNTPEHNTEQQQE